MAVLIIALEFLHNNGFLHRDLAPENIIFDEKGYPKLADFGLAREWRKDNMSDTSGRAGYIAPEILLREPQGPGVDYFALGVITWEIMLKTSPWPRDSRKAYRDAVLTQQAALKKADTPDSWSHEAADFINKCIKRRPEARLGLNGPAELKSHIWFKEFDWRSL